MYFGGKGCCDRKAATIKSHMAIHLNSGHDIESLSQMQEAIESFGGVPGVEAVLCRPPLSSIKKPVKWDVVSFVNNVHYGVEGVRLWRSYKIGRGKFIPWSKFHVPDQDEVPILECRVESENIKANFVPIKPRRAEFVKTSQKHQESTDEGTDDLSEESRDSTTEIFFSTPKRVALSLINAIRHYRSISNVGDTNMFLNMTAP